MRRVTENLFRPLKLRRDMEAWWTQLPATGECSPQSDRLGVLRQTHRAVPIQGSAPGPSTDGEPLGSRRACSAHTGILFNGSRMADPFWRALFCPPHCRLPVRTRCPLLKPQKPDSLDESTLACAAKCLCFPLFRSPCVGGCCSRCRLPLSVPNRRRRATRNRTYPALHPTVLPARSP
uniref:Uncharacterized protein TCIL3000_7_3430 n=1 Tax=Trypanosoma congolense (strain IL3000) TaxID=1068625 RepID=G0UQ68_TRYCI|nr:unnamed protein product [Trypanosoma congolense IL3000]